MADSKLTSEFSDLTPVGKGAFGEVYRGKEKSTGKIWALKVLQGSMSANKKEIDALKEIPEHPNIVSFSRCIELGNKLCLIMEYCSGGTLNDYLVSHRQPEPSRDLRFMRQIAAAVAFLHQHGIVHRDLKPDNILRASNGTLKVADFGLAKIITDSRCGGDLLSYYMGTFNGTPCFMAPEVYTERYTIKSDIFSMGVVFACILQPTFIGFDGGRKAVVLLLEKPIADALNQDETKKFLLQGGLNISQGVRTLIEEMLDRLPSRRPTADGVKAKLGS